MNHSFHSVGRGSFSERGLEWVRLRLLYRFIDPRTKRRQLRLECTPATAIHMIQHIVPSKVALDLPHR